MKGPETWRARQKRVLTELRGDRPQSVTALDAGLTLWRYVRMEEGETSLPAEYLRPLASAYGVPLANLLEKLGLVDAQTVDWRAQLVAAGFSEDEANDLLKQAEALDADARSGWLSRRVQTGRTSSKRSSATPPTHRRVTSSAS